MPTHLLPHLFALLLLFRPKIPVQMLGQSRATGLGWFYFTVNNFFL
jgi:hypothetical protein